MAKATKKADPMETAKAVFELELEDVPNSAPIPQRGEPAVLVVDAPQQGRGRPATKAANLKKMTVQIDEDLHHRLKLKLLEEKVLMQDFLDRVVRQYLDD